MASSDQQSSRPGNGDGRDGGERGGAASAVGGAPTGESMVNGGAVRLEKSGGGLGEKLL